MDDGRCRMLLKRGGRCKYRATKSGICGVHRRVAKQKRSTVQRLLKSKEFWLLVHLLFELQRDFQPVFQYIERLAHGHRAFKKVGGMTPRQELAMIARTKNYSRLPGVSRTLLIQVDKVLRD